MTQNETDRRLTEEAAGELRQRLRAEGWRSDLEWAAVGARAAAASQGELRRTIAYLASVRAVDGGASRLWKEGDVPAPPAADAREVLITRDGDSDWHSEVLEAPVTTVERAGIEASDIDGAADSIEEELANEAA